MTIHTLKKLSIERKMHLARAVHELEILQIGHKIYIEKMRHLVNHCRIIRHSEYVAEVMLTV